MRQLYGFFSETQSLRVGVVVYTGPEGTGEIRCTAVSDDPLFGNLHFTDRVLLGPVGEFLRRESEGSVQGEIKPMRKAGKWTR